MPAPTQFDIERRSTATGVEMRATDTGTTLRGYAVRFGSEYNMGWFTEEVSPEAFRNADMTDVRVLKNHDPNQVLGRTKSGTARTGVDTQGLWYEVDLPNSPDGENMRVAAERGDIDQSSWGFRMAVGGDRWEKRNGKQHRTLVDVSVVYDTSPVTFPANPDTSVAKRSMEMNSGTPSGLDPNQKSDSISYVIDNAAWALVRANDMIAALNRWIEYYDQYAQKYPGSAQVYATLSADSKTAKTALVQLMDGHAAAIQSLNNAENRAADTTTDTLSDFPALDFRLRSLEVHL